MLGKESERVCLTPQSSAFAKKTGLPSVYFAVSLLSIFLIPFIVRHFSEINLPPLKAPARFFITALYLNLAASYFLYLKSEASQGLLGKREWGIFFIFAALLCLAPPVFSGDLMECLIRGRIFAVYHLNPYQHVPEEFPNDLLSSYSIWRDVPHTYGPLLAYLQALPVMLFPNSVSGMIWAQKMILLFFYGVTVLFFAKIVRLTGPEAPANALPAFALNPLLVVCTVLDGHNDIVMLCFTVVSLWCLLRGRFTLCFLFWSCAFLAKYTVVLLLPLLVVYAVKREASRHGSFPWAFIFKQAALNLLFIAAVFAPIWNGKETFIVLLQVSEWFYTNTIPYAAHQLLGLLNLNVSQHFVKNFFLAGFGVFYVWALAVFIKKDEMGHREFFGWLACIYLCFFTTLTSPLAAHYFLWALPWLILARPPAANFFITLYSFTALFSYFKRMNYLILIAAAVYLAVLAFGGRGLIFWKRKAG